MDQRVCIRCGIKLMSNELNRCDECPPPGPGFIEVKRRGRKKGFKPSKSTIHRITLGGRMRVLESTMNELLKDFNELKKKLLR